MFPTPMVTSMYDPVPSQNWRQDQVIDKESQDQLQKQIYKDKGKNFRNAVLFTILFIILSNPAAYRLTNQLYQAVTNRMYQVINEEGNPTFKGIIIHGIVFFIVTMFNL